MKNYENFFGCHFLCFYDPYTKYLDSPICVPLSTFAAAWPDTSILIIIYDYLEFPQKKNCR